MSLKSLQKSSRLEIKAFQKPKDIKTIAKTHIPFSGSPQKHPYDSSRIILVSDPYSPNTFYIEFKTRDIVYIEELPNVVTLDGETITMARIWVKKSSIAVRCTPFVVEDTRTDN
jgi:inorganic pyrophosphatase